MNEQVNTYKEMWSKWSQQIWSKVLGWVSLPCVKGAFQTMEGHGEIENKGGTGC